MVKQAGSFPGYPKTMAVPSEGCGCGTHRVQSTLQKRDLVMGWRIWEWKRMKRLRDLLVFRIDFRIEVWVGISSSSSEMPPESPNGQCPAETFAFRVLAYLFLRLSGQHGQLNWILWRWEDISQLIFFLKILIYFSVTSGLSCSMQDLSWQHAGFSAVVVSGLQRAQGQCLWHTILVAQHHVDS